VPIVILKTGFWVADVRSRQVRIFHGAQASYEYETCAEERFCAKI
jgi:hypothetical protein